MPLPASAYPLAVSGARLLTPAGQAVNLGLGVNWGGAQQDEAVPYGLDRLPRAGIISRIADQWGMGHVRVPFAVGGVAGPDGAAKTAKAPAARLAANPDLAGLTPWQVTAQLVDDMTTGRVAAGKPPLYVILNQHLLWPGWCCTGSDGNGLAYNDRWPASAFYACWQLVARRFAGNPYVGFDLHNEPRPAVIGGAARTPTWGTNWAGPYPTDMRDVYQRATGAIRAAAGPAVKHLVFCEGLGYATNLRQAAASPVTGGNVVYSAHDYPWFHTGAGAAPAAHAAALDANWGYLARDGHAPVWVGEFGANTDADSAAFRSGWLPSFLAYYRSRPLAGACWWELAATAVLGTEPVTGTVRMRPGGREGFGLMAGQDWRGSQVDALAVLAPISRP
jgi:endoglucanase